MQEFVKQYYQNANYIPQEILLPHEMEENQIIQSWLRQKKGKKVEVQVPVRGDKKKLVDMATENATPRPGADQGGDARQDWATRKWR